MVLMVMMTLAFPDIASLPATPVEEKVAEYNDSLFYIYTSGTTGEQNHDNDEDEVEDEVDNDDDDDDEVDNDDVQVCRKQPL